ncbi:MAG: uracil phosphoribosyltransferase [Elusimicrobia bacterium]|nr:uracil phosphoribosyltransferase [Elusimicrobiota bacterium]
MNSKLVVSDHPLVQEKLAVLRDRGTRPEEFRRTMGEVSTLMGAEVLRGLKTRKVEVRTPLGCAAAQVSAQPVAFVAVLRAGLGMLPGLQHLLPKAPIGHIGLYRNEETLNPVRYYVRLPKNIAECFVVLCDPMLATGGSAAEALHILKLEGVKNIALLGLIAARAGVGRVQREHPDVPIFLAGVDAALNRSGFIVPGLGDAGDRLFAT